MINATGPAYVQPPTLVRWKALHQPLPMEQRSRPTARALIEISESLKPQNALVVALYLLNDCPWLAATTF